MKLIQRGVAGLMLLLGLSVMISNGVEMSSSPSSEDISSQRPSEEGEMVEQPVQLVEQWTAPSMEQQAVENLSGEKFLSKDERSYAKKLRVDCDLPSCELLLYNYELTRIWILTDAIKFYRWRTVGQILKGGENISSNFEIDGPDDSSMYHHPWRFHIRLGENPTRYRHQYHFNGQSDELNTSDKFYFLQILSLNGRRTSDDLQFDEYGMKYTSQRGSTHLLFDFREGEKYGDRWYSVLDSDGVNGHKPAYVNWKYDASSDEFLIVIADHEKD